MKTGWATIKPVKALDESLEPSLADVESHMPAGHPYKSDRHVTWAHESSHGLNASIRNSNVQILSKVPIPIYSSSMMILVDNINAFYVLQDRAMILHEPPTTMTKLAERIPNSLRGMSYNLYLVQQRKYWNDTPLYVFDEWSAYANGLSTALDRDGGDGEYSDVLQALEFTAYSFCLLELAQSLNGYDVALLQEFVKWQAERVCGLCLKSKKTRLRNSKQNSYWDKLCNSDDTSHLRETLDKTYGPNWLLSLTNPNIDNGDLGIL